MKKTAEFGLVVLAVMLVACGNGKGDESGGGVESTGSSGSADSEPTAFPEDALVITLHVRELKSQDDAARLKKVVLGYPGVRDVRVSAETKRVWALMQSSMKEDWVRQFHFQLEDCFEPGFTLAHSTWSRNDGHWFETAGGQ